jgi:heme/copper-type cytochrome/quinol oxidase subunit 4
MGLALLVAVLRPSWRVPVLALATVQFALHSLNHLLDIGRAHPASIGYFDFFSLFVATVVLAWLWRMASFEAAGATRRASAPTRAEARLSPTPGRSIT